MTLRLHYLAVALHTIFFSFPLRLAGKNVCYVWQETDFSLQFQVLSFIYGSLMCKVNSPELQLNMGLNFIPVSYIKFMDSH